MKKKQAEERAKQDDEDPDLINPNHAPAKKIAISDLGAPRELTRRERSVSHLQSRYIYEPELNRRVQGSQGETRGKGEIPKGNDILCICASITDMIAAPSRRQDR